MVGIRHVRTAAQQRFASGSVSRTRKPRHVDNGLFGMSYIYRKLDHGRARWLTTDLLKQTLKERFYKDFNLEYKLGPQFQRCFDKILPQLATAGMIRFNDRKTKFRISRIMASIMTDAANEIEGLGIKDAIKSHYAHCDYIRRKIGRFRPTLKALMEEIEELRETIDHWDQHAKRCPLSAQHTDISREMSLALNKTFNDSDILESSDIDDDVSMAEEPMAGPSSAHMTPPAQRSRLSNPEDSHDEGPLVGPSSAAPITPLRHSCPPNSNDSYDRDPTARTSSAALNTPLRRLSPPNTADAYPTPESLPRRRGRTQTPSSLPPSRSYNRDTFSFRDASGFSDNMDIDDGLIPGPSSPSSPTSDDTLAPPSAELLTKCNEWEMKFVKAVTLVQAPEPTLESIEQTLQKYRETVQEKDREINDLKNEMGAQTTAFSDQLLHLSNQCSQYAADYQTSCEELQELEDEFQVVKVLYYEARDEYEALLEEQQKTARDNLARLNRRQRLR